MVGYLLKLYKYNVVPIVLGIILGDIAEEALQQGLILYDNNLGSMFSTFLQRPICIVLLFDDGNIYLCPHYYGISQKEKRSFSRNDGLIVAEAIRGSPL